MPTRAHLVHLVTVTALAMSVCGLAGCAKTTRHGDATLQTRRPMIGPEGHREWWLELPVVGLAEPGSHRFRLRGLPRLDLYYDLLMIVPEARRHEQNVASAPWRDTSVTVTVLSPGGAPLGGATYRLGDLFGRNGFGGSEFELLPEVTEVVPDGGDYDIVIRVDAPSARRSDRMRIRASTTTNDRVGPPHTSYDAARGWWWIGKQTDGAARRRDNQTRQWAGPAERSP